MTSRLPLGPRRYAEIDKAAAVLSTPNSCSSTTDTKSTPSKNFSPSECATIDDPVITPNPFVYNAPTTPFNCNLAQQTVVQNTVNAIPSSQLSYVTPNRRRSSKAKGVDIDKIPRPDINAETSYAPVSYITTHLNNPPPSYTTYVTIDDGNAGPRYIRSSLYRFPTEESIANATRIPLGVIAQPLADPMLGEEAVFLVDAGEPGPLRCQKCRGYVNSNWVFIQAGKTGVCNLCKHQNPVHKDYICELDANGKRTDTLERPELCKGVYEFVAPASYHTRKLVTPNIVICIDASTSCYMMGVFHQVMFSLQSLLDYIPAPELTNVCIITYDTGVNFFRAPADLSKELSVIHVPEVDAACLPLPKQALFLNLKDKRDEINFIIEKVVKHYDSINRLQKGTHATCFGTALSDCCNMLLQDGGRVLMFSTQPPTTGLGKIKKRDDIKLYGTEKERNLYVPQTEEYGEWAKTWLEKKISLDLFCFTHEYFDLATIGQVCNVTGGNIYYYPTYNSAYDGERLHYDISRNLTRSIGYDAVMTMRLSKGVSFLEYALPAGRRPVPELHLSTIDADTVVNAYFKHEEKLKGETVGMQIALLYTNSYGLRVIRVINFNVALSNELPTIFRSADVETVAQLIIKKNALNISHTSVPKIRKELIDNLAGIFHSYKVSCAPSTSPTQLVFPEQLSVLPVFFLATLKSGLLRTIGDTKADDRSYDLHRFLRTPLNILSNLWYIKVYPLHTIYEESEFAPGNYLDDGRVILGSNIAATDERLESSGIYLLDNNDTIFVYVKRHADPVLLQELFGVETFQDVMAVTALADNPNSYYLARVVNIIDQLRKNKNSSYQPLRIVAEKDSFEASLLNLLVEDERLGESYSNFLCAVHKLIQECK